MREGAVNRETPLMNWNGFVGLKADHLSTGMDASVGSSRGDDRNVLLGDACERCF